MRDELIRYCVLNNHVGILDKIGDRKPRKYAYHFQNAQVFGTYHLGWLFCTTPVTICKLIDNGVLVGQQDEQTKRRTVLRADLIRYCEENGHTSVLAILEGNMKQIKVGHKVWIKTPENPKLDGTEATVKSLQDWGCFLDAPAAASGEFRAVWSEMITEDPNRATQIKLAKASGFTEDQCSKCGSFKMKRNGTCLLCTDCGETSGCS
jgi:hypothetical protein